MSQDRFARIFKERTGDSFGRYRRKLRMEKAKGLLLHSSEGIKTIAAAVGYSSHSYFTREFREYAGISPQQFRSCPPKIGEIPDLCKRMPDLCK
ncbi:MAG: helix-turn-helix transcriptional regulator [Bryobacteraceae bacterium]